MRRGEWILKIKLKIKIEQPTSNSCGFYENVTHSDPFIRAPLPLLMIFHSPLLFSMIFVASIYKLALSVYHSKLHVRYVVRSNKLLSNKIISFNQHTAFFSEASLKTWQFDQFDRFICVRRFSVFLSTRKTESIEFE